MFPTTPGRDGNFQNQRASPDTSRCHIQSAFQNDYALSSNKQQTTANDVDVSTAHDNINSSPIRNRSVKISLTNKSVGEDLKNDVNKHTSDGISVTKFLRLAFKQDDQHFTEIVTRAEHIIELLMGDAVFIENVNEIKDAISYKEIDANTGMKIPRKGEKNELGMYKPIVNMANMILEEAEKALPDDGKKIRLWSLSEMPLSSAHGQLKPDLVLIPKDVRDRVQSRTEERIDVREILSVFELKVDKNATSPKFDTAGGTGSRQSIVRDKMNSVASNGSTSRAVRGYRGTKRRSEHDSSQITKRGKNDVFATGSKVELMASKASGGQAKGSDIANDNGAEEDLDKNEAREKSNDASGRIQLARYITEVLRARGDRKSAYGVRLNAHEMTLSYYHRSGMVDTEVFDIHVCKKPEYFAIFLLMFQRNPSSYGFNTTMGYCDPFDLDNKETQKMNITDVLKDKNHLNSVYDDLEIEKQEAAEFCLVGRGGSVFKAKAPNHEQVPTMAVKFSWQSTNREHETVHMNKARDVIPDNVATTYGYATIADDSPIEALIEACPNKGHYTKVDSRILVMKHYKRLSEVEDYDLFWELIVQLILCEFRLLRYSSLW